MRSQTSAPEFQTISAIKFCSNIQLAALLTLQILACTQNKFVSVHMVNGHIPVIPTAPSTPWISHWRTSREARSVASTAWRGLQKRMTSELPPYAAVNRDSDTRGKTALIYCHYFPLWEILSIKECNVDERKQFRTYGIFSHRSRTTISLV